MDDLKEKLVSASELSGGKTGIMLPHIAQLNIYIK